MREAFEVWKEKAVANNFSPVTIRNTSSQLAMIQRFWTLDLPIVCITERMYLQLITSCRKYGYSEETIYNINGCLRKLITLAFKNRYIDENPIDYSDILMKIRSITGVHPELRQERNEMLSVMTIFKNWMSISAAIAL